MKVIANFLLFLIILLHHANTQNVSETKQLECHQCLPSTLINSTNQLTCNDPYNPSAGVVLTVEGLNPACFRLRFVYNQSFEIAIRGGFGDMPDKWCNYVTLIEDYVGNQLGNLLGNDTSNLVKMQCSVCRQNKCNGGPFDGMAPGGSSQLASNFAAYLVATALSTIYLFK
ncbi:hypothetical protein B566_EDAN007750 [Ephemera danica]|nr:hypothetical protein B566_EDAN007750 [Ephemera danica]